MPEKVWLALGSVVIFLGMMGKTGLCILNRCSVQEVLKEKTKNGIAAAEWRLGVHYHILLRLPHFDQVRFTAIDVMHNLFLKQV